MIAFVHTSKTSPKNCLMASSVCGLVGLFGIDVLELDEDRELAVVVEGGTEVYAVNGGKDLAVGLDCGAVLGGCGRCRSMKRVEVGVRKVEIWDEAKWSTRLRYLQVVELLSLQILTGCDTVGTFEGWSTGSRLRNPGSRAR